MFSLWLCLRIAGLLLVGFDWPVVTCLLVVLLIYLLFSGVLGFGLFCLLGIVMFGYFGDLIVLVCIWCYAGLWLVVCFVMMLWFKCCVLAVWVAVAFVALLVCARLFCGFCNCLLVGYVVAF